MLGGPKLLLPNSYSHNMEVWGEVICHFFFFDGLWYDLMPIGRIFFWILLLPQPIGTNCGSAWISEVLKPSEELGLPVAPLAATLCGRVGNKWILLAGLHQIPTSQILFETCWCCVFFCQTIMITSKTNQFFKASFFFYKGNVGMPKCGKCKRQRYRNFGWCHLIKNGSTEAEMESRISESGKKTMKQLGFGALLLYLLIVLKDLEDRDEENMKRTSMLHFDKYETMWLFFERIKRSTSA